MARIAAVKLIAIGAEGFECMGKAAAAGARPWSAQQGFFERSDGGIMRARRLAKPQQRMLQQRQ
jgi:hypothetical protein